jgi:hypothetical protein
MYCRASKRDVVFGDYKLLIVNTGEGVKDISRISNIIRCCELDHCQFPYIWKIKDNKLTVGCS